jgi:hypothetical protein
MKYIVKNTVHFFKTAPKHRAPKAREHFGGVFFGAKNKIRPKRKLETRPENRK